MKESYLSDKEMEKQRFCFTENANFLFTDKQVRSNLIII